MIRLLAIAMLAIGTFSPAWAQPAKIFVASTGSDAADGSRVAPKRSLQAAHDAVAAGGAIVVLDTAGYGALVVTKSIAVTVPPGVNGFVTVASPNNGIFVNAGPTDIVSLSGLIVEGGGNIVNGGVGILANSVGTLIVEDCQVRNFYNGIFLNASVSSRMTVRGGSVRNAAAGVLAQAIASGAIVTATVSDLLVDGMTTHGFSAFATGGATTMMAVNRCTVTGSNNALRVNSATLVADGCTLAGNTYAFFKSNNLGTIISRGTNTLINNANKINAPSTVTVQPGE